MPTGSASGSPDRNISGCGQAQTSDGAAIAGELRQHDDAMLAGRQAAALPALALAAGKGGLAPSPHRRAYEAHDHSTDPIVRMHRTVPALCSLFTGSLRLASLRTIMQFIA